MPFSDYGKRVVFAAFDGGEITSDAGVLLLRERARRIRLFERMAGCFTDHRDRERRTHALPALLTQRVCGMALGYEDTRRKSQLLCWTGSSGRARTRATCTGGRKASAAAVRCCFRSAT